MSAVTLQRFAPRRPATVEFLVGNVGGLSEVVPHRRDNKERREWIPYRTAKSWVEAVETKGARVPVKIGHRGRTVGTITATNGELAANRVLGLSFRLRVSDFDELQCGGSCGVSLGFTSAKFSLRTIGGELVREILPDACLDHIALVMPPRVPFYRLSEVRATSAHAGSIEKAIRDIHFRTFRGIKSNGWVWWS